LQLVHQIVGIADFDREVAHVCVDAGAVAANSLAEHVGAMTLGARLWRARFTPTGGASDPTPERRESLRIAGDLQDSKVIDLNPSLFQVGPDQ
jgi:hypothetical protein